MTVAEAAQYYFTRGFHPIPIPLREKSPKIKNWPSLRLTGADIGNHFNGAPSNIGLILGDEYGAADVDLDSPEAVAIAGESLPETAMVFGRKSKPASHFFYRCDPPVRSKRFADPVNKRCLVELRCQKDDGSIGLQTVVPPSVHPDGEEIRFEPGGDGLPGNVDANVLQAAVAKIAAASVLARHWPAEKAGRNSAFLALAGALARGGLSREDALAFHRAIYRALWGVQADFEACRAEVVATYEKHRCRSQTTGKRSLMELVDKRAVERAFSWLGIAQLSASERDQDALPPKQKRPHASVVQPISICMQDLLADDSICVPEPMVEGVLPERGLVLLGGRPKDGKSWFACQLALSVATGQPLGGRLQVCKPGRVHLWALEDHFALTKDKVKKLLGGASPDGLRDLHVFDVLAQPILCGGDQIICGALKQQPAELIIFDSLFKLTGGQHQNYDISQRDYNVIDKVRKIAIDHKCAAVVVMHTKKGSRGGNPIENILGTSGTSAAADVVAELKRKGVRAGKLTVVGRLVQPENYDLGFYSGPDIWGWTIESVGDDDARGQTQQEVLAYLVAQGPSKAGTIATGLQRSFGSVWQALLRLQDRRKVSQMCDKKWEIER